jgi:alkylation response protein AidB-like acyl-CoA dehydrogenase
VAKDEAASTTPQELQEFREWIRGWIQEHAPQGLAALADWNALPAGDGGQRAERLLQAMQHPLYEQWNSNFLEAGFVCAHWPAECGGRGWDRYRMSVFVEECYRARVPRVHRGIAEAMVGPALMAHGAPEQQARFLPRIISGEDRYCQGFSEPDHGSDLAGVRTRGVVDGDELIITGQKTWTSEAHRANMIFILCRTDPTAAKHRGLSYVLAPFEPGPFVKVHPVRQMTGAREFSEEFIDGLRVPLANVVGGLNNGWAVAMTTLGGERSGRATAQQLARTQEVLELIELVKSEGRTTDPLVRQQLAWAYMQVELLRYARLRLLDEPEGTGSATWKLQWSEFHQRLGELAMSIRGPQSLVRPEGPDYPIDRWQDAFLASRASTIYAGTSNIQRNIIAERVLGLPRE